MTVAAAPRNLLLLLCLLALARPALADERILSFHSEIAIGAEGGMEVTETLRVRAEGAAIVQGIYREFPTDYHDRGGHRMRVAFEFRQALRDGEPETWRSERASNGVRVYVGQPGVRLLPGEYTWTLRYRTDRQLYFGADRDELYWNVTGNGWAFPIDAASATLRLPRAVPASALSAYGFTGVQDSLETALEAEAFDGGARYRSTRALGPSEGLSVVLEFPKGVVTAPTTRQRAAWLLADNRHLLVVLAGLALLWAWYGWMWRRLGRDPVAGVRVPVYEPPNGYSAASLRFIREMGYDNDCFAAGVLGLAAKGALTIEEDSDRTITLRRTGTTPAFGPGERVLYAALFDARKSLELRSSKATAAVMGRARAAHKSALAADFEKKYFVTNRRVLIPGVAWSLLVLAASVVAMTGEARVMVIFMSVWLGVWSVGVYALVSTAVAASRSVSGVGSGAVAIGRWLFALPFLGGQVAGLVTLAATGGVGFVLGFAALIGTNVLFYHWMKAPTQLGARLRDRIEGFRWYLGVAEKQELDSRYQPESRPELFSAYLPYALALGVEQAWARRFAAVLTPAQLAEAQPHWYHSRSGLAGASLASLSSHLGSSLSGAISSASTAPGSGSGGGGGGSGGGGGGGGGGGW